MTEDRKTLTQAARLLDRSRQRVWQMYQEGKFPNATMESIGDMEMIMIPLPDIEAARKTDKA